MSIVPMRTSGLAAVVVVAAVPGSRLAETFTEPCPPKLVMSSV